MRVLLKQDVEGLATKGAVCNVADGYARNYLIPKGLAIPATKGVLKQAADMSRAREAAEARAIAAAKENALLLKNATISIPVKVGKSGKLFGSVSPHDIANAIEHETAIPIDRKQIGLDHPVKELCEIKVPVKLHAQVVVEVGVTIVEA